MARNRKAPAALVPTKTVKLNLGSGQNPMEGYVNVDIAPIEGVDVVCDLRETPWPWMDGEVEEVQCHHFFEHLDGPQRMTFMSELYRVLKPGATAMIVTPYWANQRAIQDPTHQWPPVCESSYLYFNKGWRETNGLSHYPITCDFDFAYGYSVDPNWTARSQEARDFAIRHYNHAVFDLVVTLTRREE